jgi:uncharacterized membrane protein
MRVNRYLFGVLVLALFASLLLNVLLGGIEMGHAAKPMPAQAEFVSLGPVLKSLPEADRRVMHRAFAQHRDEIQKDTQAAKASALALREALEADPYDVARVHAALDDYHAKFHVLHDLWQTVFWDAADHISEKGRQQLAESSAFERTLK